MHFFLHSFAGKKDCRISLHTTYVSNTIRKQPLLHCNSCEYFFLFFCSVFQNKTLIAIFFSRRLILGFVQALGKWVFMQCTSNTDINVSDAKKSMFRSDFSHFSNKELSVKVCVFSDCRLILLSIFEVSFNVKRKNCPMWWKLPYATRRIVVWKNGPETMAPSLTHW